jgi:hypothetical protein
MPFPTLTDNGQTVTLDLHGATVNDAVDLAVRVVREAARRGRSSVKLIHGTSTSETAYDRRSIKNELHDLLDRGAFGEAITSDWRADTYLLLSLHLGAAINPTPMRLLDFL